MEKKDTAKKYATIAAICFAVYGLQHVIETIIFTINNTYTTIGSVIYNTIYAVIILAFAVSVYIRKKGVIVAAAVIYSAYLIHNIIYSYVIANYVGDYEPVLLIASVSLIVILVLAIKGKKIIKKIWFIAGAAFLAALTIQFLTYVIDMWAEIYLVDVLLAAGFTFTGLWAREDVFPDNKEAPITKHSTFNPQDASTAHAAQAAIGGADKLIMYKELLDSGIITPEEFDLKKRQILGL